MNDREELEKLRASRLQADNLPQLGERPRPTPIEPQDVAYEDLLRTATPAWTPIDWDLLPSTTQRAIIWLAQSAVVEVKIQTHDNKLYRITGGCVAGANFVLVAYRLTPDGAEFQRRWLAGEAGCFDCLAGGPQRQLVYPVVTVPIENDPADALMPVADLAEKYSVSQEALRKRLDRWRQKNWSGWKELKDSERSPRDPRFLYQESAVLSIIEEMQASDERPTKKNPQRNSL